MPTGKKYDGQNNPPDCVSNDGMVGILPVIVRSPECFGPEGKGLQ